MFDRIQPHKVQRNEMQHWPCHLGRSQNPGFAPGVKPISEYGENTLHSYFYRCHKVINKGAHRMLQQAQQAASWSGDEATVDASLNPLVVIRPTSVKLFSNMVKPGE